MSFDTAARLALLSGADRLADLVELTLGPAARTVLVERAHAHPVITAHGHQLALELELPDAAAQAGVQALRELAWRTREAVGDGTATAICLARAILRGAVRATEHGLAATALQAAIAAAQAAVMARLARMARPADGAADLVRVAASAGADATLAALIGDAVAKVGKEGIVRIEEGHGRDDLLDYRAGLHLEAGWLSAWFATGEAADEVRFDDPFLLLVASPVRELAAIVPALNAFAASGRPLVLIAEDVSGEALATLVANRRRAGVRVVAVKAPGAGAWRRLTMGDIAVATGATVIGDEQGLRMEEVRPAMVGRAREVRVGRRTTTILEGRGDHSNIAARCAEIRHAIAREKHLSFDREQHERRLARLVAGIATLRLGAAATSALAERQERASAALAAARAALSGGILVGGGMALLRASQALCPRGSGSLEERAAQRILDEALAAPLIAIARNRGRDGRVLAATLRENGRERLGYDALGDRLTDLEAAGILDPADMIGTALRHAVATAVPLAGAAAIVASA